jgi:hypothetical protein
MGYRAILEANPETVQDLEISAARRLSEATALHLADKNHTAIYIAGLSAEMYLKTACFFVGGAKPADRTDAQLSAVRQRNYTPPFQADIESGHGLWFWSQELIARRQRRGLRRAPKRFLYVIAGIYMDWFVGMRYRPGVASSEDAARFVNLVEWLAINHAKLRR